MSEKIDMEFARRDDCLERMVPSDLRLLISERDKAEAEAQALREEVAALRARVVVVPDRAVRNSHSGRSKAYVATEHWNEGFNDCLDELARFNGLTVSEGLLRRISDLFPADMGDDGSGRAGWFPHVRETVAELRALLNQDKENGNG